MLLCCRRICRALCISMQLAFGRISFWYLSGASDGDTEFEVKKSKKSASTLRHTFDCILFITPCSSVPPGRKTKVNATKKAKKQYNNKYEGTVWFILFIHITRYILCLDFEVYIPRGISFVCPSTVMSDDDVLMVWRFFLHAFLSWEWFEMMEGRKK